MYQSEYPASSINILSSDTLEPNVVSKSPTMAELIPIYNAFFTASTLICERPPADFQSETMECACANDVAGALRDAARHFVGGSFGER